MNVILALQKLALLIRNDAADTTASYCCNGSTLSITDCCNDD